MFWHGLNCHKSWRSSVARPHRAACYTLNHTVLPKMLQYQLLSWIACIYGECSSVIDKINLCCYHHCPETKNATIFQKVVLFLYCTMSPGKWTLVRTINRVAQPVQFLGTFERHFWSQNCTIIWFTLLLINKTIVELLLAWALRYCSHEHYPHLGS